MAKQDTAILLRWSEHVPASDVQDPLGLGLRGSTRLASRLLFCITSITPRARYFSFIPWCVQDWQTRERGKSFALGLRDAIVLREKALTLGCIAHHRGTSCAGGALVGSDNVAKWFAQGQPDIDLRKLPFAKNPALGAYFNSLVNLGMFLETDDVADAEEDSGVATLDDLQLSDLGKQLADGYDSMVGRLESVQDLATPHRRAKVANLREWGLLGGLCELAEPTAADRQLLRDVFFARVGLSSGSHLIRRRSLLLILELCRQSSASVLALSEAAFGAAVYFGEISVGGNQRGPVEWPEPLQDVAMRWRMFYFHHYMSVALEGMFAWLVTLVADTGLTGASLEDLANTLSSGAVSSALTELFAIHLPGPFADSTPSAIFERLSGVTGGLDPDVSRLLDERVRPSDAHSEARLESLIREADYIRSPAGLAIPMLLLGLTLGRYRQFEDTTYGDWLASAASDPYLDLVPPVLIAGLSRRFRQWWDSPWKDLAAFVLDRYVLRQHQSMSYVKTAAGDRCLLEVDGLKIMSNAAYDKIGMGNPRLGRAISILKDLALLAEDDGVYVVTTDGMRLLEDELATEARS